MAVKWNGALRLLRISLLGCMLAIAASLSASEGGFTATLSIDQKKSSGLEGLAVEQRAVIDRIVAVEVAEARNGSGELDQTFIARRTDEERKAAGLDQLTSEQQENLNDLVAAAMSASPKPKERPRIRDTEIFTQPRKPEVHGGVSLTYGRSSGGGDFRSASMWVDYFDPNSGLGLSVGITQSKGSGFYGFYPDSYGYDYGASFGRGLGYLGSPYLGFGRDDWYEDDDLYFRDSGDWNSPYYRRGVRRR